MKAKNVVHAWNGYGDREKFLPERLYENFSGERTEVVAVTAPNFSLTKVVDWAHPDHEWLEFGISDRGNGAIIIGG